MSRQFEDLTLGSLELFCLCAETESFTAAALQAGLTPAAVSRSVARLEARLGVSLFVRSTRQVRLSEDGRAYYEQCRVALNQLIEAEREITGQQHLPAGTVRISMPTALGHCRVLPLLPAFRQRYPAVAIEAHVSNRNIDFVAEGYDLAIRGRTPPDSGLVARHLLDAELVVVATADYLRRAGTPRSLDELRQHDCIQFLLPSTGARVPWLFREEGQDVERITDGGYHCTDDVMGAVTLARHGAGVLQTYRFIVDADLRSGALIEVLPSSAGRSRPFSLMYPGNRHVPLRVRVFIDYLMAAMAHVR